MFSGEQQQALRVLTLCGKGRSGAVASEEVLRACGILCGIVMLGACELLHVACRDERLGADAGSQQVYGLFYLKRNYSLSPPCSCHVPSCWRRRARPVRRCASVELQVTRAPLFPSFKLHQWPCMSFNHCTDQSSLKSSKYVFVQMMMPSVKSGLIPSLSADVAAST